MPERSEHLIDSIVGFAADFFIYRDRLILAKMTEQDLRVHLNVTFHDILLKCVGEVVGGDVPHSLNNDFRLVEDLNTGTVEMSRTLVVNSGWASEVKRSLEAKGFTLKESKPTQQYCSNYRVFYTVGSSQEGQDE